MMARWGGNVNGVDCNGRAENDHGTDYFGRQIVQIDTSVFNNISIITNVVLLVLEMCGG